MSERKLRFALFGNVYQPRKSASIRHILSLLAERGAEVCIERTFHEFITRQQGVTVEAHVFEGSSFDADFVISMGGDGTLLKSACFTGDKAIPIMGVNMGRLGFLADVHPDGAEAAIDALYRGTYDIEQHAVIQVEADGGMLPEGLRALNDIAVLKRDNASMISIRACIDGQHLADYQADGLIVSTPTGSTAYSLSNGGPIVVPQAGVLCLTPVAPHSLNIRPMVIRDDSVVTLTVESRSHNFLIAVDGRSEKCEEGTRLTIRKAPYTVGIVRRQGRKYFSTLREKMMWGADLR